MAKGEKGRVRRLRPAGPAVVAKAGTGPEKKAEVRENLGPEKKAEVKEELSAIHAEVASFAASLGLAPRAAGSGGGFDDSDFRKKGPLPLPSKVRGGREAEEEPAEAARRGRVGAGKGERGRPDRGGKESSRSSGEARFEAEAPEGRKGVHGKSRHKVDGQSRAANQQQQQDGNDAGVLESALVPSAGDGRGKQKRQAKGTGDKGFTWRPVNSDTSLLPPATWYEAAAAAAASLQPVEQGVDEGPSPAKTGQNGKNATAANEPIVNKKRAAAGSLSKVGKRDERDAEKSHTKQMTERKLAPHGSLSDDSWEMLVEEKRKEGLELLQLASESYAKSRAGDSDAKWLEQARHAGTTADKIAAMTVMLQDDPVANLRSLDALLGMVTSKGGKRHAAIAIDALRELFLSGLLPDRKLKQLSQQPLQQLPQGEPGRTLLLLWQWEDSLKERYEQFVTAIEEASRDPLPFLKEKAVKVLYELLKGKPEQERRLLAALVNKLGDPERKVASNAGFYLGQLLTSHPNMRRVVVQEVDHFVFRPHVGGRAQYYAAVFLNQIVLTHKGDGPTVARNLIDLYFALFKMVTEARVQERGSESKGRADQRKKKDGGKRRDTVKSKGEDKRNLKSREGKGGAGEEVDTRLLAALLTGVNRAFPFVAAEDVERIIANHTPSLFRMVHASSFNLGVQALMLLQQILAAQSAISGRYYRALYAVLLSPALAKSSKGPMFLSVLFKAMKSDLDSARIAALVKRLLQVSLQQPPAFACGALLLVSELLKVRPALWKHISQPEDHDGDVEHFVDIVEEGDISPQKEEGADGVAEGEEEGEDMIGERIDVDDEDDSDENDDGDDNRTTRESKIGKAGERGSRSKQKPMEEIRVESTAVGSGLDDAALKLSERGSVGHGNRLRLSPTSYDMKHRDPAFCRADQAGWWELHSMAAHIHPSVAAMARTLLAGATISYGGDPLRDLTLGVFLDRMAEKKPKTTARPQEGEEAMGGLTRGHSLMQPIRKAETKMAVGSAEFAAMDESQVPAEDVFFHKFFSLKAAAKGKKKKDQEEEEEELEGAEEETESAKGSNAADGFGDEIVGQDDSEDEDIEAFLDGEMAGESGGSEDDDDDEDMGSDGDFEDGGDELEMMESEDERQLDRPVEGRVKKGKAEQRGVGAERGKRKKSKNYEEDDEDDEEVEVMDFGDETSEDEPDLAEERRKEKGKGLGKGGKGKKVKRRRSEGGSAFASAEEYAHLMN